MWVLLNLCRIALDMYEWENTGFDKDRFLATVREQTTAKVLACLSLIIQLKKLSVWFLQCVCLEYTQWITWTFCCTSKCLCRQLLCKYNSWNIGYSASEQYNMTECLNKFCWQAAVSTASGSLGWTANKQKGVEPFESVYHSSTAPFDLTWNAALMSAAFQSVLWPFLLFCLNVKSTVGMLLPYSYKKSPAQGKWKCLHFFFY